MDRRGFLRGAMGVGVATAAAKLWLPPISIALAQPERRVFLPPSTGWMPRTGPYSHRFTISFGSASGVVETYGDQSFDAEWLIGPGATERIVDVALSPKTLRSMVMAASESGLVVDAVGKDKIHGRIMLPAGTPLVVAPGLGTIQFDKDIDRLVISNPGTKAATFRLNALSET